MYTNYKSTAKAVTTAYTVIDTTPIVPIRGIQNTTAGDLYLKFGGGTGEVIVMPLGFYEPIKPFLCTISAKSTVAGNIVVLI